MECRLHTRSGARALRVASSVCLMMTRCLYLKLGNESLQRGRERGASTSPSLGIKRLSNTQSSLAAPPSFIPFYYYFSTHKNGAIRMRNNGFRNCGNFLHVKI